MNLITLLNKYGRKVSLTANLIYDDIKENKKYLDQINLKVEVKNPLDLYCLDILIKGLKQQELIDKTFDLFLGENVEILKYMNSKEKRDFFFLKEGKIFDELKVFFDKKTDSKIYIPHLEDFLNRAYSSDYELILVNNYQKYLKETKYSISKTITMYGPRLFASSFSLLEAVGKTDDHYYFYSRELGIGLVLDQVGNLVDIINLVDKYQKEVVEKEVIKDALIKLLTDDNDLEVLDYLLKENVISEKAYKKISRKISR